jgi:rRNA maturation endonuclease Nob1
MPAARVRLVCTECKWKIAGTRGDSQRRGCERCGGQLRELTYTTNQRRRARGG